MARSKRASNLRETSPAASEADDPAAAGEARTPDEHEQILDPSTSERRYWRDPLTGVQVRSCQSALTEQMLTKRQETATAMLSTITMNVAALSLHWRRDGAYTRLVCLSESLSTSAFQNTREQSL